MGSSVTVASCAMSRGVLQSPVLTSLSSQQALMDKFALEMGNVTTKEGVPVILNSLELTVHFECQ